MKKRNKSNQELNDNFETLNVQEKVVDAETMIESVDVDTEIRNALKVIEISRDNMRCKKVGKVKITSRQEENYNQKVNVNFGF